MLLVLAQLSGVTLGTSSGSAKVMSTHCSRDQSAVMSLEGSEPQMTKMQRHQKENMV